MEEHETKSVGVIRFSEEALRDFSIILAATATYWGDDQAQRYSEFLQDTIRDLANEPSRGRPVEGFADYMAYTAKFATRSSAHGHRIFYRLTQNGIMVSRILHTAMLWEQHLE